MCFYFFEIVFIDGESVGIWVVSLVFILSIWENLGWCVG